MKKEFETTSLINETTMDLKRNIDNLEMFIDKLEMTDNNMVIITAIKQSIEPIKKYINDKYDIEFDEAFKLKSKLLKLYNIEGKHMYEYKNYGYKQKTTSDYSNCELFAM